MPTELVFTAPRQVAFRDYKLAANLAPREIRVRTLYSGISHGTEMNVYRGTAPQFSKTLEDGLYSDGPASWTYPMTYGYEEVGVVVEVGPEVTEVKEGDIIASAYGHREEAILNIDQQNYFNVVPESMDPASAIFHALGSVALDAYLSSEIRLGESAVVIGLGVIGQFIVELCRLGGIHPVIAVDLLENRRAKAMTLGATHQIDPSQNDVARAVRDILNRRGAEVVFDATGSYRGLQEAIRCGAPIYGRVMAVGWYQGEGQALRLGEEFHHSSFGVGGTCQIRANNHRVPPAPARAWDIRRVVNTFFRLMATQQIDLDGLISHRIPFPEAAMAFELVDKHTDQVSKVILDFQQ